MIRYIVYKTTNLVNGKIYVGVHKTSKKEFDGYFGSNKILSAAIKKHGRNNFKRDTLMAFSTSEMAFRMEGIIVDQDFIDREDTYNLVVGGKGNVSFGSIVVERKIGIHALTFEQRSFYSKRRIANTPRDVLLKRSSNGGKIGAAVCKLKGVGFFGYTLEQRREYASECNKARKERDFDKFIADCRKGGLSGGKIGGPKNAGFKWYNDGINDVKYTPKQQLEMSFEEFMELNPQFMEGRSEDFKTSKGSKWYTDGNTNFKYTIIQQSELSFEEFLSKNLQFSKGQCKSEKSIAGTITYNDGSKNYRYTLEQQSELPFEEFLSQNLEFVKGLFVDPSKYENYTDGITNFRYTLKQQSKLSFEEFLSQNPEFVRGQKCGESSGCKYYNDGSKSIRYTKEENEQLSFEEFLLRNPQFTKGYYKPCPSVNK
jgi:hypothetical protein